MRSACAGALFVAATALVVADARAADTPLRVRFRPGSVCADEAAFTEELRARGLSAAPSARRLDRAASLDVDVAIEVWSAGAGYEAKMVVVAPGEPATTRTVRAATCDEVRVTFALTLELALASLPDAPQTPRPIPELPEMETAPDRDVASANAKPGASPSFGVGGASRMLWGATPSTATALGIFGEIDLERPGRILSPRFRAGAFALLPSISAGMHERQFALQWAELAICPVRFFTTIVVRPCAQLEVGRLQGWRDRPGPARDEEALWAALEVGVSARWVPAQRVFVELEGSAGPELARPVLALQGNPGWEGPPVVGHAGASAGMHFW